MFAKVFLACLLTMVQIISEIYGKTLPTDGTHMGANNLSEVDRQSRFLQEKTSSLENVNVLADSGNSNGTEPSLFCPDLTEDLEKSWNLTERVAIKGWGHLCDLGPVLYDLINCQATILIPVQCIASNLLKIKDIVDPAIREAIGFFKEGIALVPDLVKDTKKCFESVTS